MAEFDKQDTHRKIVLIVAQKLKIEPESIAEMASLEDLGADSLDLVSIVMQLEDQFGIKIDDAKVEQFKNINDVVDYVHSLRSK